MNFIIFIIVLFFSSLTVRIEQIFARSEMVHSNTTLIWINLGSSISLYAMMLLGFLIFPWWFPIISIIICLLLAGGLINQSTLGFFYKILPITGISSILLTVYSWLMYLNR